MTPAKPNPYSSNIEEIVNFLKRSAGSGFLFCACDNTALVRRINENILETAKARGMEIAEAYVPAEPPDAFLYAIRQAAEEKPAGVIVNNIDEAILISGNDFIRAVNFSREILIELDLPLVFWLSESHMSRFANKAPDFFIRRDRGVLVFADVKGQTALDRMETDFSLEYKSSENHQKLKIRAELLENQLREMEKKGSPEKRIALEIASDLIELYNKSFLRDEAIVLFEKYGKHLEQSPNVRNITVVAGHYQNTGKLDEALSKYFQNESIYKECDDKSGLARTYNNIGLTFFKKNELDSALEYYFRSVEIKNKIRDHHGLGRTYNNIGLVYSVKGEWDKALEYHFKSEKIRIEVDDLTNLGPTYNNIGDIYRKKGALDKALTYHSKAEEIRKSAGDIAGLGWVYYNMGLIYQEKGELNQALDYFHESEKLMIKVGDKRGLAYTLFNIGKFLLDKNREKAENYLLPAGYLAKSLHMDHEFSKWRWAFKPIIAKVGEGRFMADGERLYREKIQGFSVP